MAGIERRDLPLVRRGLAALGGATILLIHRLLLYLSLAATVVVVSLRRGTWHGPVRIEFRRVLHEVTVRSLDLFLGYDPSGLIALISPTPLLMVVGLADHLTPADLGLAAYERALQPKRLVSLRGGHFDAYGNDFTVASSAAADWFSTHLGQQVASR